MKKRLLPILLALTLTLPLPALAKEASTGFTDVSPEDWFAPYVVVCVEEGLLNGVGEDRFAPGQVLNSDEALVMAARVLLKANGEAEFPKGPDAQGFWDWAGENAAQYSMGLSVDETQWYVDSWCWDPLVYLAQAGGPDLFPDGGITYATDRYTFFKALSFAAQGLELPVINTVEAVPGTRDERVLDLYRAGILAGTDLYGSFDGQAPLTRAEAAAALARLARPELRVEFALQESPYQGYFLTPLMEYEATMGLDYPVVSVLYCTEDYQQASGLLTLDGKLVDYPEGRIYSSGVSRSYDYAQFHVIDALQWTAKTWLMDKDGNYAPGSGEYQNLWATGDGHFVASNSWSDGSIGHTSWYLLSPDGKTVIELPETLGASYNDWSRLNEGLCPWQDEETGLWGYVDLQGNWVMEPMWSYTSSFEGSYAVLWDDQDRSGIIDRNGILVFPFQEKQLDLPRSAPGHEAEALIRWYEWNEERQEYLYGYLDWDGTVYPMDTEVPRFYNGFAAVWDDAGNYYLDARLQRRTESFDWCSDLTPDGQGFVGIEGKIYRIEFETP